MSYSRVCPSCLTLSKTVSPPTRANALFLIRNRRHTGEWRRRHQRSRSRSARSQSGGIDDVDGDVRTIRDIDRALHLPVEHCGRDEALRKQHERLLARNRSEPFRDRRERREHRTSLLQTERSAQSMNCCSTVCAIMIRAAADPPALVVMPAADVEARCSGSLGDSRCSRRCLFVRSSWNPDCRDFRVKRSALPCPA